MGNGNQMDRKVEDLMQKARCGWASGKLASASDFEFVEDAWIDFHLDQPISRKDVRRLEEIVVSLERKVPFSDIEGWACHANVPETFPL